MSAWWLAPIGVAIVAVCCWRLRRRHYADDVVALTAERRSMLLDAERRQGMERGLDD